MSYENEVLSALLRVATEPVILLSIDGTIRRVNQAFSDMIGYDESDLQGVALAETKFVPLANRHEVEALVASASHGRMPLTFDSEWETRSGRLIRISWKTTVARGAEAPLLLLAGEVLDEGVWPARLLIVQNETLRILLGNVSPEAAAKRCLQTIGVGLHARTGAYWIPDEGGATLFPAVEWTAIDADEVEDGPSSPDIPANLQDRLPDRIWSGGPPSTWFEIVASDEIHSDGTATDPATGFHFGFPVREGNRTLGVMTFFSNQVANFTKELAPSLAELGEIIGEGLVRRRTKRDLYRSELRKSAMLEASLDCIITIDHLGKILEFNPAAERTFGHSRDSVMGKSLAEIIVPPEYREAHYRGIRHYLASGEGPALNRRIELPALRANGEIFPSEISIVPTILDGTPIFTGYIRDITEKKRVEEEMRRAMDAAEAGSRAKTEFLTNMSHELRTPMTAILGSADMLQEPNLTPEHHSEALRIIRRNGEHLMRVINNILSLSKLDSATEEPEITAFAPWPLVAEVVSALNVQAREKNVELAAGVEGIIPTSVLTDSVRLRHILTNLISNAIKFTAVGRIDVRMRVAQSTLTDGDSLEFEVIDQGVGMTPEQVSNLFTPFYQVDASLTRSSGGTGLGLLIARRLAESLDGEISVESQLGRGSRFTIKIPFRRAPGSELIDTRDLSTAVNSSSVTNSANTSTFLQGHILVVEDSRDNQRVLSYHLSRLGITLDIAENGRKAVELGTSRPYDMVLMDIQMPELDGYSATRLLRRAGFLKPIVALTAHAMAGDEEKCLAAGCDAYLRKPVEVDRLAKTLRRYLTTTSAMQTENSEVLEAMTPGREEAPLRSDFADDVDFMELVTAYVKGLPDHVAVLRDRLTRGQTEELCRVAHTLRGSGGMYGYDLLSDVSGQLEDAISGRALPEKLAMIVAEIEIVVNRIRAGLD